MTEIAAVQVATTDAYVLAEGPCWDDRRGRLLWVDIESGLVLCGELADDGTLGVVHRVEFDGRVGAVAPAENGDWIVALDGRLVRRRPTGEVAVGVEVVAAGSGRRLNDGRPDPAGRYVVGSLRMDGASESEVLVVVDDRGIRTLDADLSLSNGLAWSTDGGTLYSIDTGRRTVFRRSWDVATGASGTREVHVTLTHGHPDGMTIDAEDHLWIAVWGLGQVHRYSPAGDLVRVIDVPAPFTSSVAFAGADLATLVITTSYRDLDDVGRTRYPDSGRLFTVRPGVAGAPQPLWSGRLPPAREGTS
ncbi:Sugar lactone lactonase YvrE [Agromyces sp. CF514]|uniref:SMP-30/gluconolactonase/LRE family protein n=1 Tax=Agromyces sp. CF514 TaxID=1881031 RepID=UPI0008EBA14F|nr:SMP-30/gluconolactonase/LRE family protein [Agromyces sp. CF514]SFR78339.1 Sugar lactone lactonase YvrE [Agromyces sp. CF514]